MGETSGMEGTLDGNAAAGTLRAIFPFEMTEATVACASCGTSSLIGETVVYMSGMGTIVRCPACDHFLIRIARGNGRQFLDLQGVRVLEIPARG